MARYLDIRLGELHQQPLRIIQRLLIEIGELLVLRDRTGRPHASTQVTAKDVGTGTVNESVEGRLIRVSGAITTYTFSVVCSRRNIPANRNK